MEINTSIAGLPKPRYLVADNALSAWPGEPGVSYLVAANGMFKRGITPELDIMIPVETFRRPRPGLINLLPHVRWRRWPRRLPTSFLTALLRDAQAACSGDVVVRPIEKQYFIVAREDGPYLVAPRNQVASASQVRYTMPVSGTPLIDIHSHHAMPAFFSELDDRDDSGLSVSAVIGNIYKQPEMLVRLNVWGDRLIVPITFVFDGTGPFREVAR